MTLGATGKIYPTNKLFTLSKYHPVGVMIYNVAEFMGVPWETLIKMYREDLGSDSFENVHGYVDHLFQFLVNSVICTERQKTENLMRVALNLFGQINQEAVEELRDIFAAKKRYTSRDASRALGDAVARKLDGLELVEDSDSMSDANYRQLFAQNRSIFDQCMDRAFEGLSISISREVRVQLRECLKRHLNGKELSTQSTGVVVAGFGDDEMFPTIVEVVTDGILGDKLKYEIPRHVNIGRNGTNASIMPFAQVEMVHRFMEGVDLEFLEYVQVASEELLFRFGKEILDNHTKLSQSQRKRVLRGLRRSASKQVSDFEKEAASFRRAHFINPVTGIVVHLPKEELASMAEALVNLTSLKRRVSAEQETVGGPIDVAVISKGDGFVWIKRKHYFRSELNQNFSHNYFYQTDKRTSTPTKT